MVIDFYNLNGGGGSAQYAESAGTANSTKLLEGIQGFPQNPEAGDVVAVVESGAKRGGAKAPVATVGIYQYDGSDWVSGGAGAQGPQGPQGAEGAQGPQGAQGADGQQGPQGEAGADGAQGPQGEQGEQGPQGPAGQDGIDQEPTSLSPVDEFPSSAKTGEVVAISSVNSVYDSVIIPSKTLAFEGNDILTITTEYGTLTVNTYEKEGYNTIYFETNNGDGDDILAEDGQSTILPTNDENHIWAMEYDGDVYIRITVIKSPVCVFTSESLTDNACFAYLDGNYEEIETLGLYQYDGSSWNKIEGGQGGSSAYKIELSTSNPDDFTAGDEDNLNAFFAAVEEDTSIIDTAYINLDGDIYTCVYGEYNGQGGADFSFVLPYANYIYEIDLHFENGEYSNGYFYENNFNTIYPNASFPADPVEGQIANYDDGQGNIGLYRYDGEDWQPYGGQSNILKGVDSAPELELGDVCSIPDDGVYVGAMVDTDVDIVNVTFPNGTDDGQGGVDSTDMQIDILEWPSTREYVVDILNNGYYYHFGVDPSNQSVYAIDDSGDPEFIEVFDGDTGTTNYPVDLAYEFSDGVFRISGQTQLNWVNINNITGKTEELGTNKLVESKDAGYGFVNKIVSLTQDDYDDLVDNDNVDENTLYLIIPAPETPIAE